MSENKPSTPTVFLVISLLFLIGSAAASIWRNLQPLPTPVYREYGGTWRQTGVVSSRPDDWTVCQVARNESERLGRVVTVEDVEAAIIEGRMVPEPVRIDATRTTYRISPSYYIKW